MKLQARNIYDGKHNYKKYYTYFQRKKEDFLFSKKKKDRKKTPTPTKMK